MEDQGLKNIASQLRLPEGEYAIEIGERMNEGNHHINLYTIEALNLKGEENILEVGMGNGFFVQNILNQHPGVKYSGCDHSETMVEESIKKNIEYISQEQADFQIGHADKLPFVDAIFDKVFTINTLYFWKDTHAVFNELKRVLKPAGQITIAIRPRNVMKNYPFVKYGFNMFDREELLALMTDNNFNGINVLELEEPAQEINAMKMPVSTLLVSAEKKEV